MPARKAKAHKLPASTQQKIGREYVEGKNAGKDVTLDSIAAKYSVTRAQVHAAAEKYRTGGFANTRGRKKRVDLSALDDGDVMERLERQINVLLLKVEQSDLEVMEHVRVVDTLVDALKTIQQIRTEGIVKGQMAKLIVRVVKRFKGDVSDTEIWNIIAEERAAQKEGV